MCTHKWWTGDERGAEQGAIFFPARCFYSLALAHCHLQRIFGVSARIYRQQHVKMHMLPTDKIVIHCPFIHGTGNFSIGGLHVLMYTSTANTQQIDVVQAIPITFHSMLSRNRW